MCNTRTKLLIKTLTTFEWKDFNNANTIKVLLYQ